mmetsp:Transcript_59384/g.165823  ORF Transcript_59384/g.165823 Transcript_59384/m.165823 type:complete len:102 (-) Transcript_59384:607-912(-)
MRALLLGSKTQWSLSRCTVKACKPLTFLQPLRPQLDTSDRVVRRLKTCLAEAEVVASTPTRGPCGNCLHKFFAKPAFAPLHVTALTVKGTCHMLRSAEARK